MKKFEYYTNGTITKQIKMGDQIPVGFYKGHIFNANPWTKGQTKDTNAKVAEMLEKRSQTLHQKDLNHPHNYSKTKEDYEPLQRVSKALTGKPKSIESKEKNRLNHLGKKWCQI